MTYELALSYLASLNESRIKPGLERIRKTLLALGSPHLKYPHILVGGTNGKGSVVSFMGSVLTRAGYRTGLFTSPHLHRFEERIAVGQDLITSEELTRLVDTIKSVATDLTYFEFATAMALLHFSDQNVDLAILEVGLGGSWDATNVTDPFLSVITSVDLDHTEWLGNTVQEVAWEKTGIMRQGKPVITGSMGRDVMKLVLERAQAVGATVVGYGRDYRCSTDFIDGTLHFEGLKWNIKGLSPGMKGRFQLYNAACALAALEVLAASGFEISETEAAWGIESARWAGRFTVLEGSPRIVIDAAHNRAAVKALVDTLGKHSGVVWLFSALSGKDIAGMTGEMARLGRRFVLLPLDHPRAIPVDELEKDLPENAEITKVSDVKQGLDKAREMTSGRGLVVAAGSVVLAGEVLKELSTRYPVPGTQDEDTRSRN